MEGGCGLGTAQTLRRWKSLAKISDEPPSRRLEQVVDLKESKDLFLFDLAGDTVTRDTAMFWCTATSSSFPLSIPMCP